MLFLKTVPSYYRKLMEWLILTTTSNPPVSVTDGSAYDKPYNVTQTLQYNAAAGLQLLNATL